MRGAVERAVAEGFTQIAFGDLFLEDVRRYREDRLAGTGLTPLFRCLAPTRRRSRADDCGRRPSAHHLPQPEGAGSFVRGARVRRGAAGRAAAGRGPMRERGEFHTCAYGGPMFAHPVPIETGITVERDGFVFTDLCVTPNESSV